jgi:hypothetical protein
MADYKHLQLVTVFAQEGIAQTDSLLVEWLQHECRTVAVSHSDVNAGVTDAAGIGTPTRWEDAAGSGACMGVIAVARSPLMNKRNFGRVPTLVRRMSGFLRPLGASVCSECMGMLSGCWSSPFSRPLCTLNNGGAVANGNGWAVVCRVEEAGGALGDSGAVPSCAGVAVVYSVSLARGALGDGLAVPKGDGQAAVRGVCWAASTLCDYRALPSVTAVPSFTASAVPSARQATTGPFPTTTAGLSSAASAGPSAQSMTAGRPSGSPSELFCRGSLRPVRGTCNVQTRFAGVACSQCALGDGGAVPNGEERLLFTAKRGSLRARRL